MRVVIEDAQLKVIRANHKPVFASDEFDTAGWYFWYLKRLDQGARFMIIDVDSSVVKTRQDPWFGRVEVDTFYSIWSRE